MTDNSFWIPGLKPGEWETVADRIKRRPLYRSEAIWYYEYSITRNYEGEEFTVTGQIPPEVIDSVSIDELNVIVRDMFFGSMSDVVKERDGNWIEK